MKRFIAVMLLCALYLVSCAKEMCAEEILSDICKEYPLDATIYSSGRGENESGYIDTEMLVTLYGTEAYPTEEFAIALYGKVDTVREIGVFITKRGDDTTGLTELLSRRIDFLSSAADGEGFVKKYRGATVYAFVADATRLEALLDSMM